MTFKDLHPGHAFQIVREGVPAWERETYVALELFIYQRPSWPAGVQQWANAVRLIDGVFESIQNDTPVERVDLCGCFSRPVTRPSRCRWGRPVEGEVS